MLETNDDLLTVSFVEMGDALAHDAIASVVVLLIHADIQNELEEYDYLEQEAIKNFVEKITNGQVNFKRVIDDGLNEQYHPISSQQEISREQIEEYEERNQAIAVKTQSESLLPEPQAAGDRQKLAAMKEEIEQLSKENDLFRQVVKDIRQQLKERNMPHSSEVSNGILYPFVTKSQPIQIINPKIDHLHIHVNDNSSQNHHEEKNIMDNSNTNNTLVGSISGIGHKVGIMEIHKTEQPSVSFDEFKKELCEFHQELLNALLDELKIAFSDVDFEEIKYRMSEIERQLQSPSPKPNVIQASYEPLKQYLIGVASSLSANILPWVIKRINEIQSLVIQ